MPHADLPDGLFRQTVAHKLAVTNMAAIVAEVLEIRSETMTRRTSRSTSSALARSSFGSLPNCHGIQHLTVADRGAMRSVPAPPDR
jgi:hypothetical protein